MTDYTLIAVLVTLLAGLAIGKAWERYKLRGGRLIDRRRLRDTPHRMLALLFIAENQPDLALEELTRAIDADPGAFDLQLLLGNVCRQKGQASRAIAVHQALLQRSTLTRAEHAWTLLCLGLDFRHAGFVDRALEAFREVVRLDPSHRYALVHLQKLHEEQRQWAEAAAVREQIAAIGGGGRAEDRQILAFLRNEVAGSHASRGDSTAAASAYREAIDTDAAAVPAYLGLGDLLETRGSIGEAIDAWESIVSAAPDRAYLAFDRIERGCARIGTPDRFVRICERLIARGGQDWRARLALSRHLARAGRHRDALELLLAALPHNPHGLVIHQAIWESLTALALDPALVHRYVSLTRDAVFYLDPHVCRRCRYRATELLWQCPQCHEWDTFVEERIAPATDAPVREIAGE
jgi:lipopolysaccharide biosynthesis regulator YciM